MRQYFESESDSLEATRKHFVESLRFPFIVVVAIWAVHFWQMAAGWDPADYGIISRRVYGLRGIVTGPLVHGSWGHIFSNTFPLLILTWMMAYFYRRVAQQAFFAIYLLTGTMVWMFARSVSHIGASGVIYGLVAFIFWNGIFRRSMRSIILGGIVMLLYSGMFLGVLPDQEGISWESHLIGSLAGIFAAFLFKGELEDEEAKEVHDPFADERDAEKTYFLPQDIFEKTKAHRAAEAEEEARRRAQDNDPFSGFWHQSQTW